MSRDVERVAEYLKNRSLHASHSWIEGCVEYFKSQRPGRQVSIFDVQNFAFEQWLLVDLRSMGIGSLPSGLASRKEITLSGKYAVQVECVKDISTPAYSQLLLQRGVSTENCEATQKLPENWEPKPGRVLKLFICDGVQELVAMEYSPVRELDKSLIPGTKILIIGPVKCRRGIFLLEQKNVSVLGGELDTLLTVNSVENVLSRALSLTENPNPPCPQVPSPDVVVVPASTNRLPSAPAPSHRHQPSVGLAVEPPHLTSHSDFPDDMELADLEVIEEHITHGKPDVKDQGLDDTLLDDDDDDLLLQLPVDELASASLSQNVPEVKQAVVTPTVSVERNDEVKLEWPSYCSERGISSSPFIYLSQLVSSRPVTGIYHVKGFLLTLLSTLEQKEGRWQLLAKLSDGSANMDVSFSEEVLDELIGFSATEMVVLRQKMAGNPAIKEKLKQGFQQAKKKLHDLNCIFYLQFSSGNQSPIVVNIEDLAVKHFNALKSRSVDFDG